MRGRRALLVFVGMAAALLALRAQMSRSRASSYTASERRSAWVALLRRAARVYCPDMFAEPLLAPPERFDSGSPTPCWAGGCLPAFHIVGVYQSGVRDLYSRLAEHGGVVRHGATSQSFYSQVHPKWPAYMRGLAPAEKQARAGKLLGEASAVTFHFIWVHQEKFNAPYVEAMGAAWRACNDRPPQEKAATPHASCMARAMAGGRAADVALAAVAGVRLQPPTLMRAVYGAHFEPAVLVLLRLPWERLHASWYNYPHYRRRYGDEGEGRWVDESIGAFRACEANFTVDACALRFESLSRPNEETFYHCDQLIKGMYSVFLPHWRRAFPRLLALRSEEYFVDPAAVLARALRFLRLTLPATDAEWAPLLAPKRQLHGPRPAGGTPPLQRAVERSLRRFYAPGLRELAEQLSDAPDAAEWRAWAARAFQPD